jgi:endonuclease/exonuclease/phosphatase family metal-dependent hydrolase
VVLGFDPAEAGRPEYKLVQVGPKSMTIKFAENDPGQWVEVFSPDGDCVVKNFTLGEVRARYASAGAGKEKFLEPHELVSVITQKPNPDYPNSTPKGGTGIGMLFWENDLDLEIMSFNIRYGTANDGDNHWEKRKELVFDVLREERPDVAGLQEALRFQIDQIQQTLPVYQEIGVGREDGKEKGEYSVILYRQDRFQAEESGTFWFSDTPELAGSRHWGNDCVRICSWARLIEKSSRRAFYIYNLHLVHQSQPSREKSVQLLARRIRERKHPDPFIVTGDFNAEEDNPAVLYLQGNYTFAGEAGEQNGSPVAMRDSFRVLFPEAAEAGTFHGFAGRSEGGKIDYIFVSPDIEVRGAEIIHTVQGGRYPSDHFPVAADVFLPGDRKEEEP